MAEYANPPLLSAAPANGTVPVYNAATDRMDPTAVAAVGVLVVPQAHEASTAAGVAQTGATVATTNAIDLGTAEALANALKVDYNKTITDVANLVSEHNALVTAHNALVAALQTAGILAAS